MRRAAIVLLALMFLVGLTVTSSAAINATQVTVTAYVDTDESCRVIVDCSLYVDQPNTTLRFPVPLEATNITLNDSSWGLKIQRTASAQFIDLSGLTRFSIRYTLPDVIGTGADDQPELQLPLLSGFEYPISRLDFSVTLPGEVPDMPAFSSGYHQASIEKELTYNRIGPVYAGNSLTEIKDHETLNMTLRVNQALFPDARMELFSSDTDDTAMLVCAILALAYWLLFLRTFPARRQLSATAPEGCTAGHLGAMLTLGKLDLTMMVFSWAQLGYILIQIDRHGRVLLHKRMEMGNERTNLEQKCFRNLFGRRNLIDTASLQYVTQYQKVSGLSPNFQFHVHPHSGNPKLFRAIAALVGLFGGISVGIALTIGAAAQAVWVFLMAVLGLAAAWLMQDWAGCLFLRDKTQLWIACAAAAVMLILSAIAGQFGTGLLVVLSQLMAGLMAAYGGRRTDAGKQDMAQILGLRRYLKTIPPDRLHHICQLDPDYFHNLAPYALALGVDQVFAKRFGKEKLPACPYLTTGMDGHRTAMEWSDLLRSAARTMNSRAKKMPLERLGELFAFIRR